MGIPYSILGRWLRSFCFLRASLITNAEDKHREAKEKEETREYKRPDRRVVMLAVMLAAREAFARFHFDLEPFSRPGRITFGHMATGGVQHFIEGLEYEVKD